MASGDKKGDKNLAAFEAKAAWRVSTIDVRHDRMRLETLWALNQPVPSDFTSPPAWVKSAIELNPSVRALRSALKGTNAAPNAQSHALRSFAEAAVLAVQNSLTEADPAPVRKHLEKLHANTTQRMDPLAAEALAAPIPAARNIAELESGKLASIAGVKAVRSIAEIEPSLTEQVCYFLHLFWPEVETAKNLRETYDWFTAETDVACTFELFKKVCRSIGLRQAGRGRPRGK